MKKLLWVFLMLFPFFSMQGEIKAVVFDYGNVIMRFKNGRSPTLKFISDVFDASQEDILREIKKDYLQSLMAGNQDEEIFWQTFAVNLNVPYPENWIERWQQFHMQEIEINTELLSVISELKAQGYQVGLLSNQVSSISKAYRNSNHLDPFDPVILSCEVKAAKPDPEIYHILLQEMGLKGEEILFVDDKEENLIAAQKLGIQTIHYNYNHHTIEDFLANLEEHGINSKIAF